MDTSEILRHLYSLDTSSPDFSRYLYHLIQSDGEDHYLLDLQGSDSIRLVDFLDKALNIIPATDDVSRLCLHKLQVICSHHGTLPSSYIIAGGLTKVSDYPVASGGFADVWEGTHNSIKVCIKCPKITIKNRRGVEKAFFKEAVAWKWFKHQNIVPFIGVTRDPPQFVSEWMPNGTLTEYIGKNPGANRVDILLDVAEGLAYLHAKHAIHGDLKGPNILVDRGGRARLADFGFASVVRGLNSVLVSKVQGFSPRWAAPEIIEKGDRNTQEADVYAFSMVVIEVFTGSCPFSELTDPVAVSKAMGRERPDRPQDKDLTDPVWDMTVRCWQHDPDHRPRMTQVVATLRECHRSFISATQLSTGGPQRPRISSSTDNGGTKSDTEKFGPLKVALGNTPALCANHTETSAVGNKVSNLLSRIDALEDCFDSPPSGVPEQGRRVDLIRKLNAIGEQLRLFSEKSGLPLPADHVQASEGALRLLEDVQEAIIDYQTTQQTMSNHQRLMAIDPGNASKSGPVEGSSRHRMEGNKDEALQCLSIAQKHRNSRNYTSARKFIQRSLALFTTPEAEKLAQIIESEASASTYTYTSKAKEETTKATGAEQHPSAGGTHHRHPKENASKSGPAEGSSSGSEERDYTPEQLAVVKRVRACAVTEYYEILELKKGCGEADVKKAYRKLALALHPDLNGAPGADEAFKMVSKAFQVLSDSNTRAAYDRHGADLESRFSGIPSSFSRGPGFPTHSFRGNASMTMISPEELPDMSEGNMGGGGFGEPVSSASFGGPGMTFTTGGTRMRRQGQQRQQQQGDVGGTRGLLAQLAPILILFLLSLLSALPIIFTTSQTPDPQYSFTPSTRCNSERMTGSLGVKYHVNSQEFMSHPIAAEIALDGAPRGPQLSRFEDNIEKAFTRDLMVQCQFAIDRKHRRKEELIGIGTDQEKIKEIDKEPIEACDRLKHFGLGIPVF